MSANVPQRSTRPTAPAPAARIEEGEIIQVGALSVASTRAAQEVQAAMVIAKRFPRDSVAAFDRVMTACRRPSLAEDAIYTYPRGGTQITGPSIRLAEVLAQAWGNLDFGWIELERGEGESTVQAYAWDLETNTRKTLTFTVRHEREVGTGADKRIVGLSDPRDIYEMCANQAARRLRQCILSVIPGDVCDEAMEQCQKTMAGGSTEPLKDRARKMVVVFGEFGVTQAMIEAKLGHPASSISEPELVRLRGVYQSLKDGVGSRDQFFDVVDSGAAATGKTRTEDLAAKLGGDGVQKAAGSTQGDPAAAGTEGGQDSPDATGIKDAAAAGQESTPPVPEQLTQMLVDVCGCTPRQALDRLVLFAKSLFKADFTSLTEAQYATVRQRIADGSIKVSGKK